MTMPPSIGYCEQGDLQTMMKKQKVSSDSRFGRDSCFLPFFQSRVGFSSITQGKLLDEVQLRRWLAQLLLALHYMQTKNVLHRDLKSSNVFLTAENDVQVRCGRLRDCMMDQWAERALLYEDRLLLL